jgi:hypothetical protein
MAALVRVQWQYVWRRFVCVPRSCQVGSRPTLKIFTWKFKLDVFYNFILSKLILQFIKSKNCIFFVKILSVVPVLYRDIEALVTCVKNNQNLTLLIKRHKGGDGL